MTQAWAGGGTRTSAALRQMMVDGQIRTFDVTDQHVLEMFYRVPREAFLPAALAPLAYSDAPILLPMPGSGGRAQMLPMFLAKLLQNGDFEGSGRALVVGGGTGYAAAILAGLSAAVVSLEQEPAFTATAAATLGGLGFGAVQTVTGPLTAGYPAGAPYDRILVPGGVDSGLERLFDQLAPRGLLLAVDTAGVGASRRAGKAVRFDKIDGGMSRRVLFDATVPVMDEFREAPAFVF